MNLSVTWLKKNIVSRSFYFLRQSITPTAQYNLNGYQPTIRLCYVLSTNHTHPFNGPFSETTRVGQYQKGKINLDFTEARDSEWQWHQLDHMQVYTSLQKDNHASIPPLTVFTGRVPFLPPNQQRQSTKGKPQHKSVLCKQAYKLHCLSLSETERGYLQWNLDGVKLPFCALI